MTPQERGRLGGLKRWENTLGKAGISDKEQLFKRVLEKGTPENLLAQEATEPIRVMVTEVPKVRQGIERELRVVRVGPNPRLLLCEYWELASRRTCRVMVGRGVKKFVRGMVFKLREPVGDEAFAKPWPYEGKLPRLRGRW